METTEKEKVCSACRLPRPHTHVNYILQCPMLHSYRNAEITGPLDQAVWTRRLNQVYQDVEKSSSNFTRDNENPLMMKMAYDTPSFGTKTVYFQKRNCILKTFRHVLLSCMMIMGTRKWICPNERKNKSCYIALLKYRSPYACTFSNSLICKYICEIWKETSKLTKRLIKMGEGKL